MLAKVANMTPSVDMPISTMGGETPPARAVDIANNQQFIFRKHKNLPRPRKDASYAELRSPRPVAAMQNQNVDVTASPPSRYASANSTMTTTTTTTTTTSNGFLAEDIVGNINSTTSSPRVLKHYPKMILASGPDLPPTPPAHSRNSSATYSGVPSSSTYVQSPQRSDEDVQLKPRPPATPTKQLSPPTPDVTPPYAAGQPQPQLQQPQQPQQSQQPTYADDDASLLQTPVSQREMLRSATESRAASFTTAREQPSDDEDDEDHSTLRRIMPSAKTSQSTVRRYFSENDKPAQPQPQQPQPQPHPTQKQKQQQKQQHPIGLGLGLESSPEQSTTSSSRRDFQNFEGGWGSGSEEAPVVKEWDDNLDRNVYVRKRAVVPTRNHYPTTSPVRDVVVENLTVSPTRATEAVRSMSLPQRILTFPSPHDSPEQTRQLRKPIGSLASAAPIAALQSRPLSNASSSDKDKETRRISTMSSKSTVSTVIEASLVDTTPQRRRTLRHVKKQIGLRDSGSDLSPASSARGSLLLDEGVRQRRVTDGRYPSNGHESTVSTTATSVSSRSARREVWKNGGIPVVVVPERISSVRSSSREASVGSTSSRRSKRSHNKQSNSTSQAPEQPIRRGRPLSRPLSEIEGSVPGDQRTIDYAPVVPRRSSSLSAPTSRNHSRSGSLARESTKVQETVLQSRLEEQQKLQQEQQQRQKQQQPDQQRRQQRQQEQEQELQYHRLQLQQQQRQESQQQHQQQYQHQLHEEPVTGYERSVQISSNAPRQAVPQPAVRIPTHAQRLQTTQTKTVQTATPVEEVSPVETPTQTQQWVQSQQATAVQTFVAAQQALAQTQMQPQPEVQSQPVARSLTRPVVHRKPLPSHALEHINEAKRASAASTTLAYEQQHAPEPEPEPEPLPLQSAQPVQVARAPTPPPVSPIAITEPETPKRQVSKEVRLAEPEDVDVLSNGRAVSPFTDDETISEGDYHSFDDDQHFDARSSFDHHDDYSSKHLSPQNTPFSMASVDTTTTHHSHAEVSQALAVNIYPHQNTSVLVVDHSNRPSDCSSDSQRDRMTDDTEDTERSIKRTITPEVFVSAPDLDQIAPAGSRAADEAETSAATQHYTVAAEPVTPPQPTFTMEDVDSPLRNPRMPPEPPALNFDPPAINFIPATPSGMTPAVEVEQQRNTDREAMREAVEEERPTRRSMSTRIKRAFSRGRRQEYGPSASRTPGLFTRTMSLTRGMQRRARSLRRSESVDRGKRVDYDDEPVEEDKLHPFWRPSSSYQDDEDMFVRDRDEEEEEGKTFRYPPIDNRPHKPRRSMSLGSRVKKTFAILPNEGGEDDFYPATSEEGPERRTVRRTPSGNLRVVKHYSYDPEKQQQQYRQQAATQDHMRPYTAPEQHQNRWKLSWRSPSFSKERDYVQSQQQREPSQTATQQGTQQAQQVQTQQIPQQESQEPQDTRRPKVLANMANMPNIGGKIGDSLQTIPRRFSERRREKRSNELRQKISGPQQVRDGVGEVIRMSNHRDVYYDGNHYTYSPVR